MLIILGQREQYSNFAMYLLDVCSNTLHTDTLSIYTQCMLKYFTYIQTPYLPILYILSDIFKHPTCINVRSNTAPRILYTNAQKLFRHPLLELSANTFQTSHILYTYTCAQKLIKYTLSILYILSNIFKHPAHTWFALKYFSDTPYFIYLRSKTFQTPRTRWPAASFRRISKCKSCLH
jgi:hypothetical protein